MSLNRQATLDAEVYADYVAWKGWDSFFTCRELDLLQFEGDFSGLPLEGRILLEIGFGTGALLAWARRRGAKVLGSEVNPQSLAAAREQSVQLMDADFARSGALQPRSLDYAVAFDVFEHLTAEDLRLTLIALAAALKPGGMIVMRYPNGQSPFGLTAQHGDITHKLALSRMIVEQLAMGTGLETFRYVSATYARRPGLRHGAISMMRAALRRMLIKVIQLAFATDVPLDAVMIHILRKPEAKPADLQPG